MFNNSVLNVIIGLVFIFLIYSLFATALREAVASIFQKRANTLYKGIKSMLTNTDLSENTFDRIGNYIKCSVINFWRWLKSWVRDSKPTTLYDKFYHHPIIKNYGENAVFSKPSYLTAENFAIILIDTIKNLEPDNELKVADIKMLSETLINHSDLPGEILKNLPKRTAARVLTIDCETFKILYFHLNEAAGDLNVFKSRLEQWYNDTMGRVSGWYKRHTQTWLFMIGFVLAMVLNIDTIRISTYLSRNQEIAGKLADMGTAFANNPNNKNLQVEGAILQDINAQKDSINTLLGLGWPYPECASSYDKVAVIVKGTFTSFSTLMGFFITAIAISLGAPFWFDLLNRFINLRSAGKTVNPSGSTTNNDLSNNNIDG